MAALNINQARRRITYWYRRTVTGYFRRSVYGRNVFSRRAAAAWLFINGDMSGIEIGAADNPLLFSGNTKVKYMDRITREELMRQIAEGGGKPGSGYVNVDIIDEADRLETVGDASLDFVVANHVLEHCEDPIGALGNMFRVLKSGGILFLTVPDMRYTFDAGRPVSDLEHLKRDHGHGPEGTRDEHFAEWARFVEKVDEGAVRARAEKLREEGVGIHYHSWTQSEMFDLLTHVKRIRNDFDIEFTAKNGIEMILVMRRAADSP